MLAWKIAIWHDPNWRGAMGKKGNWRKLRYWFRRVPGQTTFGPWRIDMKRVKHGE